MWGTYVKKNVTYSSSSLKKALKISDYDSFYEKFRPPIKPKIKIHDQFAKTSFCDSFWEITQPVTVNLLTNFIEPFDYCLD